MGERRVYHVSSAYPRGLEPALDVAEGSRLSAGSTTSATGEVKTPVPDHLPFPQGGTYGLVQVSPALAGLVSTFGLLELTILTEVRLH
jgi:hypothetical protein